MYIELVRIRGVVTATVLAAALSSAAPAASAAVATGKSGALLTQPRCAGITVQVHEFRPGGVPLNDWRENLEFDGEGTLWVSHLTNNQVEGYDAEGTLRATVPVPSPGGIRRGPDGLMYVNSGISPTESNAAILSFDPAAEQPKPRTVVDGLAGINGLAIDADGNFYLGREFAPTVLKLRPDGTPDVRWTDAARVFGSNGVSVLGGNLYVASTTDLLSPVTRVPLKDPGSHKALTRLSAPPELYKGLDDLEAHGRWVYVVGFLSGELLRVDRRTGKPCLLATGLRFPTSVRVPRGFGDFDPARDLFVSEASGRLLRVNVQPR